MNYQNIITIEPGKRGGKPCIRKMRITVYDVLGWLAAGMTHAEILDDFPELTEEDIKACLEFVADREHRLIAVVGISWNCYSIRTWAENWSIVLQIFFQIQAMSNFTP